MYSHNIDEAPLELWILLLLLICFSGVPILMGVLARKLGCHFLRLKSIKATSILSSKSSPSFFKLYFLGWFFCAPSYFILYMYFMHEAGIA